jgi:hypothetical protein
MNTLLAADLNAARFERNYDMLRATAAELTAAIPGSSWSVTDFYGGYVTGRVGCVELDLHPTDDGQWCATAHPTTYKPADLGEFDLNASGAAAVELAQEVLADVWELVAMASEMAAA